MRRSITTVLAAVSIGGALVPLAASAQAAPSSTAESDFLSRVRFCESTNNYKAQNAHSSASGAYQFLTTTWRGLSSSAGYPTAASAPASVQDAAARELYRQAGTSPWAASSGCWSKLSSSRALAAPVTNATPVGAPTSVPAPHLSTDELEQVDAITKAQQASSWWTPQARAGKKLTRTVVAGFNTALTHERAAFDSKASSEPLSDGDKLTGRYVNIDWFEITAGKHKGEFINSGFLSRLDDITNGALKPGQLAGLPANVRANTLATSEHLSLSAAKAFVTLNAAYREQFGHGLSVNEGYRDLVTQTRYRASLGASIAAAPGKSNHGYGNAIDFATPELRSDKSASSVWMREHAASFGFANNTLAQPTRYLSQEWWHYDFAG